VRVEVGIGVLDGMGVIVGVADTTATFGGCVMTTVTTSGCGVSVGAATQAEIRETVTNNKRNAIL
jgi:hypothetical protein